MSIQIFTKDIQAIGNFNNGEIIEKKPIGFPQDGGQLKPYSNLFYWAHAWAPIEDSVIELHPHRGFEICSFVLKGEIEHYDTLLDRWITLKKGDVQVIKAGKGISHSEKLKEGSEIFQIWFDPNIIESLYVDPSYSDFKSNLFTIENINGIDVKVISNKENQIGLESYGIQIFQYNITEKRHTHKIEKDSYHSLFIISGNLTIDNKEINEGDFIIINNEKDVELLISKKCEFFEIVSPVTPPYKTYAEIHNIS